MINFIRKLNRVLLVILMTVNIITIGSKIEFGKEKVDTNLKPYVQSYYKLLDQFCPNKNFEHSKYYTIEFGNGGDKWIGVCYWKINGYHIKIDKDFWDNEATDSDRYQLMYHEMAHCLIDKDHVDDKHNYMNPGYNHIFYEDMLKQVIEDIKQRCQ